MLRSILSESSKRPALAIAAASQHFSAQLVAGGEPGEPRGYWKNDQNCENGNALPNPELRADGHVPLAGVASEMPPRQVTGSIRTLAGQRAGEL